MGMRRKILARYEKVVRINARLRAGRARAEPAGAGDGAAQEEALRALARCRGHQPLADRIAELLRVEDGLGVVDVERHRQVEGERDQAVEEARVRRRAARATWGRIEAAAKVLGQAPLGPDDIDRARALLLGDEATARSLEGPGQTGEGRSGNGEEQRRIAREHADMQALLERLERGPGKEGYSERDWRRHSQLMREIITERDEEIVRLKARIAEGTEEGGSTDALEAAKAEIRRLEARLEEQGREGKALAEQREAERERAQRTGGQHTEAQDRASDLQERMDRAAAELGEVLDKDGLVAIGSGIAPRIHEAIRLLQGEG